MARLRNTGGHRERQRIANKKVDPGKYLYSEFYHKENGERARLTIFDNCFELEFYADAMYSQHSDWNLYAKNFPQDSPKISHFDIECELYKLGFMLKNTSKRWT